MPDYAKIMDKLRGIDKDEYVEITAGLLSQILQVHLEEKEYLLFNPRNAGDTPRYLFRVFTPYSQGTTDTHWVKSMAASDGLACGETDIFSLKNKQRAADMLNRHLRWRKLSHDNLVSWTSSLLVALVYIFHLRATIHKEATLDEIQLLVVDTATFPKGVFMRDLDLLYSFLSFDQSLRNLYSLRRRKSSEFSGYYYFGEYLSQGALKVEGHAQMVSAQKLIDAGLYDIRKEFKEFADWKKEPGSARWANAVLEIREVFYRDKSQRQEMSDRAKLAALKIARQYGRASFQAPVAASLAALAAPLYRDVFNLSSHEKRSPSAGFNRKQCLEEAARIAACDTMPELQEYSAILQELYEDYPKSTAAPAEEKVIRVVGPIMITNRS